MTMYVEILSAALAADGGDHDVPVLIDRVRETRTKMLEAHHAFRSVYDAVAAEVAYDRELVQLCAALGIETGSARFGSPTTERKRLEWELALIGIDLVVPTGFSIPASVSAGARWISHG
jgi:hypothetical protein